MNDDLFSRREFVRIAALSAVSLAAGLQAEAIDDPSRNVTRLSRVVLIRDPGVLDEKGTSPPEVIGRMIDKAVAALFQSTDPAQAWKYLAKPGDIVGIKTNVWPCLPTTEEVEGILRRRIVQAGVAPTKITVDDRGARQTLAKCTALINVRPLRTHHWAGIGGCIKNYIMFVENPPDYHRDMCADVGSIWQLPSVKGKTRLNILLLLTPQFYGKGPHNFDPRFTWPYKGLLVSQDPVAADRIGVQLLEAKRRLHFGEDRPLLPLAKHIVMADKKYHLGQSDLDDIEIMKLGWKEDVLI